MMRNKKVAFTFALGATCAISLSAFSVAHANDNPFRMNTLQSGYLLADAADAKSSSKKKDETQCDEAKYDDKQGAKAADDKCKQDNRSGETSTKVKSGWCGDGGRCGYKRPE